MVKIQAEVVNGKCPTCDEFTMLVGLTSEMYRCMNCGADLQQHINGKITYLPVITSREDAKYLLLKSGLNEKSQRSVRKSSSRTYFS
jgi:ribosomal protein S27E